MAVDRNALIDRPEDHRAIAELYRRLIDAWNRGDAGGVAQYFSDTAEYIGADGTTALGGEDVQALLTEAFRDQARSAVAATVRRTRKISFHVGVLHGSITASATGHVEHQTLVASSENGYWLIESFQSTRAS